MPQLYCGNNAIHPGLVAGTHVLGTRYQCLRRGFGAGYHSPYDPAFTERYVPIDVTRVFCGNGDVVPDGYDRLGTRGECMRKGFGAGKRKRAMEHEGGSSSDDDSDDDVLLNDDSDSDTTDIDSDDDPILTVLPPPPPTPKAKGKAKSKPNDKAKKRGGWFRKRIRKLRGKK